MTAFLSLVNQIRHRFSADLYCGIFKQAAVHEGDDDMLCADCGIEAWNLDDG